MENRDTFETPFERNAEASYARSVFMKKTYVNLAFALVAFAACEAFLLHWQPAVELAQTMV